MSDDEFKKARREKSSLADPLKSDRLPPHSTEAEQGVLGCVLLAPADCLNVCLEKFKAGSQVFYDLRHQTIYATLLELHARSAAIDMITVQQALKDKGELEGVGGLVYLASLPDTVPSAANLEHYLGIVREKFICRRVLAVCSKAASRARDWQGEADVLLGHIEHDIAQLTEEEACVAEEHIGKVMGRVIDGVEGRYTRGSTQLNGLPTGPTGNYLDKIIRGIQSTFYMVLAGRPGSGKTSEAMNIVEYLALDYQWWEPVLDAEGKPVLNAEGKPSATPHKGIPICVFSIEMDSDCLVERLWFGRAGVDTAMFSEGYASGDSWKRLHNAAPQLIGSKIYIDASPGQTIGQIAAKARRMVKQYGIKLFVLDYVQLVECEGGDGMNRVREITKISSKIMALKKQLKVPWLVLAQMNRNIETAERDRKPVLSDLKDCGALEQDADLVMFTYKTSLKDAERVPASGGPSDKEIIETVAAREKWDWSVVPYRVDFVVAKNRFGPTGEAKYVFNKNLCRFECFHMWKVRYGVENLKAGERESVVGRQAGFEDVTENYPK